jgi:hypothetical protein
MVRLRHPWLPVAAVLALALTVQCAAVLESARAAGVPRPRATVEWHLDTPCPDDPDWMGCTTFPNRKGVIHIYIGPGFGWWDRHQAMYHELGHAFDFANMRSSTRRRWRRINDRHVSWWQGEYAPGEQFAESYRMCALGDPPYAYGYDPTAAQLRATCDLIRVAGRK